MGYQETTDATSRKINMDFATVKIVTQGRPWMQTGAGRGVGIKLYKPMRDVQEKGRQGVDRKGYERGGQV